MGTDSHEFVKGTIEAIPLSPDEKTYSHSQILTSASASGLWKNGNVSSPFSSIIVFVVPAILVVCIAFLIFVIRAKYMKSRLRKAERLNEENGTVNFTTAQNTFHNEGCLKCHCSGLVVENEEKTSNVEDDVLKWSVENEHCEIPSEEQISKSLSDKNGAVPKSGILSSPLTKLKAKNFLKVRFQHLDQNQKYELLGEK